MTNYRSAFPEFAKAAKFADLAVQKRGWLKLAGGRLRHWGLDEHSHKAFNAATQGGVAETMKIAMIEVERRVPGAPVLDTHDSMVREVPGHVARDVVESARDIMTGTFEKTFGIWLRADAKQWK